MIMTQYGQVVGSIFLLMIPARILHDRSMSWQQRTTRAMARAVMPVVGDVIFLPVRAMRSHSASQTA